MMKNDEFPKIFSGLNRCKSRAWVKIGAEK